MVIRSVSERVLQSKLYCVFDQCCRASCTVYLTSAVEQAVLCLTSAVEQAVLCI